MQKKTADIYNKKVLIIDDEEILRDVLVEVMDMNNIDSYAVSGGSQGVEMYKKHKNEIGLVLLDLLMPGETGIETYHNLSNIDPNVNVIFMSGISNPESLQILPEYNSCTFIKKPFSMGEITAKVTKCLHEQILRSVSNSQKN